ncbi:MAG TPA: AAA family ATPase [Candidatus Polarisedimenticolaceae bacterium]|nr:AAA family ATPase [Candidatus Polarisedimenticolaceae bacterium]
MFSDVLKAALESEIAGQPAAIASAIRGTTRVMSGLTPRERSWCAYMFMGPSGTGKTQLVRTLARTLHGEGRGLFIADCAQFMHGDPWWAFSAQILPMFSQPRFEDGGALLEAPPFSVVLIEYLERGRKEIGKALTAALDSGRLTLPGGRLGSLRGCLVFITTSLCSREILEESPKIGFAGATGPGLEDDRVLQMCRAEASEHFGDDLVNRLDGLVVFHKLHDEHLREIFDRRFERMNRWILSRGFRCELEPAARAFLLERSKGDAKLGARELVRVFRRHLEFPVADLMISRRIPSGGIVRIDHVESEEHLHFTVMPSPAVATTASPRTHAPREVGIEWGTLAP